MSSNYYGLTPFNLALDGCVDQFYELYQQVYNSYLDIAKTRGFNLNELGYCDHQVVLQNMGAIEHLAWRRLKIFVNDYRSIRLELQMPDFKYFTFFDEGKIKDFKRERDFEEYWHEKFPNSSHPYDPNKYNAQTNGIFFLQKTAITFARFLELFQNIVCRAIYRIRKETHPHCDLFDIRKTVSEHIEARMKQRREATLPPQGEKLVANTETLYLFDSLKNTKCKQEDHPVSTKQYNVLSAVDSTVVAVPAHYCSKCKRYMMGTLSYSLFVKHYGKITNQVVGDSQIDHWAKRSESKLHKLGYTVQSNGTTAFERQSLLTDLITTNQITFWEVVCTIEDDIRTFRNHPNFIYAIPRWEEDLKFINNWEKKRTKKASR